MGHLQQNLSEQSDWDVSLTVGRDRGDVLSDSLIPQVGDTLCERNADLDRSGDEATDKEGFTESIVDPKIAESVTEGKSNT